MISQIERAIQIVESGGNCELCGMPPAVSVVGSTDTDGASRAIALCSSCAAREEELVRERIF